MSVAGRSPLTLFDDYAIGVPGNKNYQTRQDKKSRLGILKMAVASVTYTDRFPERSDQTNRNPSTIYKCKDLFSPLYSSQPGQNMQLQEPLLTLIHQFQLFSCYHKIYFYIWFSTMGWSWNEPTHTRTKFSDNTAHELISLMVVLVSNSRGRKNINTEKFCDTSPLPLRIFTRQQAPRARESDEHQ